VEPVTVCPLGISNESATSGSHLRTVDPNWLHVWSNAELIDFQISDSSIGPIRQMKLDYENKPDRNEVNDLNNEGRILWIQWNLLEIQNGILYRRIDNKLGQNIRQLVAPQVIRDHIFEQLHNSRISGHFGRDKTLENVKRRFYWTGMTEAVKNWCKRCDVCARGKPGPGLGKAPLKQFSVSAPMQCIAVDILGPLPITRDGNEYIIVTGDYFTKWKEAFAVPNHTALTVADKLVTEFFSRFGCPVQIHSDQGREFESDLFQAVCEKLGIKKSRTTPYRPQSDGLLERFNRTLKQLLSLFAYDNTQDWDDHLPYLLMAYRSTEHASTKCSPNLLMLGREISCPIDLMVGFPPDKQEEVCPIQYVEWLKCAMNTAFDFAKVQLKKAANIQKRNYDVGLKEEAMKSVIGCGDGTHLLQILN